MRGSWLVGICVLACVTPEPALDLTLEGPVDVTVEALGPVKGPVAKLSDGSAPTDLSVTASPAEVAVVAEGAVRAVGPGTATVTVSWKEQEASWKLTVKPAITLAIRPIGPLVVGKTQPMAVEARAADTNVDPGELSWTSSHPDIADVDAMGSVTGKAPGTSYLTVTGGRSKAMIEVEVVAP